MKGNELKNSCATAILSGVLLDRVDATQSSCRLLLLSPLKLPANDQRYPRNLIESGSTTTRALRRASWLSSRRQALRAGKCECL